MDKPKNVQIPLDLFNQLLDAMEYIDLKGYAPDFRDRFDSILWALQEKKKKMDLRDDYARLIVANKTGNEEAQDEARIEYLKNKNL